MCRPLKDRLVLKTAIMLFAGMITTQTALARDMAPIRYGKGSVDSTNSANNYSEMVNTKFASADISDDFFRYPDEPIGPEIGFAKNPSVNSPAPEVPKTDLRETGFVKSALDPWDPKSYDKVGKPYKISGKTYTPEIDPFYNEMGTASWYGPNFHGKITATGEIFDMNALTAAHPTLPLPCLVRVTNLENGRSLVVRVNDRGPFKKNRIIDLSKASAAQLDMIHNGQAKVQVEFIGPANGKKAPQNKLQMAKKQPKPTRADVKSAILDAHFVQLGSFESRSNADQFLETVSSHRNDGDVVFANVNGNGRYRVVLGPFNSKQEASTINASMKQSGFDGFVIRNP